VLNATAINSIAINSAKYTPVANEGRATGRCGVSGRAAACITAGGDVRGQIRCLARIEASVVYDVSSTGAITYDMPPARYSTLSYAAGAIYVNGSAYAAMSYRPRAVMNYKISGTANMLVWSYLFWWADGVGYRVIQDPAVRGLLQGGIKHDDLMNTVQRLGL
jgi:hypothetical protein